MSKKSEATAEKPAVNDEAPRWEERRKHQRIHTRLEIPYWKYIKFSCDHEIHIGFVKNMSRGGIYIETNEILQPGQEIGFEFYLPNSAEAVCGLGEVAWIKPPDPNQVDAILAPGMGIRFKTFDEGAEFILNDFIEKELAKNS